MQTGSASTACGDWSSVSIPLASCTLAQRLQLLFARFVQKAEACGLTLPLGWSVGVSFGRAALTSPQGDAFASISGALQHLGLPAAPEDAPQAVTSCHIRAATVVAAAHGLFFAEEANTPWAFSEAMSFEMLPAPASLQEAHYQVCTPSFIA